MTGHGPRLPAAVVFDFDGLIMDSEMPIFRTAVLALREHGHELTMEAWAGVVGLPDGDEHDESGWYGTLVRRLGITLPRPVYQRSYDAQNRIDRDLIPALPGVVGLLDQLGAAGVPCGVASSSTVGYLDRHLVRLGLRGRFATVAGADLVGGRGKPSPDVYLLACRELGVDPRRSVALEDSEHGIAAARAAGMRVVAVPSEITRLTDLSAADCVVASLEELTLADLAALVAS
ncbi:MAG TPA: HAD-IA family hydrolase [Acidimicrobiales bacterium]